MAEGRSPTADEPKTHAPEAHESVVAPLTHICVVCILMVLVAGVLAMTMLKYTSLSLLIVQNESANNPDQRDQVGSSCTAFF